MITTVRVQEKGQVTIPQAIRRRMKLKKGDLVTFIHTENGVVIKSLDLAADDMLSALEKSLNARGVRLDAVLERAQRAGAESLAKEFGLLPEERTLLYEALQLRAQAVVENLRGAQMTEDLSDEDIEAEIQDTRKRMRDAHRP